MSDFMKIGQIGGAQEIPGVSPGRNSRGAGELFTDSLKNAIQKVDGLQRESDAAQSAYALGENVELHDVLIKLEEAEVAFKTMMEVRNKLVEAYQEIMKMA
jgi:flagellar hook-basal body complex protein FliE